MQTKRKRVVIPVRGQGKCPTENSPFRYNMRQCNTQACVGDEICIAEQDLILVVDGSGSMREENFNTMRDFAYNFTTRYRTMYAGHMDMQIGVAMFGNARCEEDGSVTPAVQVQPLTTDLDLVRKMAQ